MIQWQVKLFSIRPNLFQLDNPHFFWSFGGDTTDQV